MSAGRDLGLNWSSEWNLHGDSIAGILFRFVYANVQSPQAMKALISATSSIQTIGSALYQSRNTQPDWKRFGARVGLSDAMLRIALLGDLLDNLRWTPVLSQRLRICPDCLRFGYHARHFQIIALEACPVHGTTLRDTCSACDAPTPFYGMCSELFSRTYYCWKCNAPYAGREMSIRTFFEPELASDKLREVWKPLDDWIEALETLDLGFATLRDWVSDYAGEYRREREIDAFHVVGTVLPLPEGRFSWRAPSLRRKSFYYYEGGRKPRPDLLVGNYLAAAYAQVRQNIARKLTQPRMAEVLKRCHQDSWGAITDHSGRELNAREIAYILWRMKFENLSEPALIEMGEEQKEVFIGDEVIPFPWWSLGQPAWKILFWATYRGLVYDVERAIRNKGYVADLLRASPTRHCCILPSTSIRGKGRGVVAYPMPVLP